MDAYERMRKIGEGAFGKAILVKHKGTSKQYVVKEINVIRMSAKEKSDSRKETAVLAQLNHPNIVRYKESFEERGSLYIVMDFCAGGDLYTRINNQRGILFHEDQVLDWFVQICLAMKHIHDRKILHRDIKSQNIFLESDGTVKIGDFGIAKVLNSTVELARTCIGTPYYLSPEIVENRPYNNKSDVWSLGCVLYELTTLKHAFEAGNMKNLILKIIRGSYPPVPSKYSYDLRGLIAQLFKRSPRDRPSINSILRKSFLQHKIGRFLSDKQIADEFSHTVMHGKKIAKALPLAPPASRPPSARKTPVPSPTPRKYDPAAVYAPVRKSKENRPGSAGGRVTPRASNDNKITPRGSNENRNAVPGHQDWEKRKQELLERERKRREEDLARRKKEAEKQREQALANKHKEFVEKQKMARINKAREEGWNNLIGSYGSDNGKKQDRKEEIKICDGRQAQPRVYDGKQGKDRGNYEKYNDYLEKLQRDKDYKPRMDVPQHNKNAGKYMNAPRPLPAPSPEPGGGPPNMARQANRNRYPSNPVNEREKIVNDYLQRKKEAEMNKARGHAQMFGHDPSVYQKKQQVMKPGNVAVNDKVKEEQEYLERLRHIRAQNYAERMALKGKNSNEEAEERKKKIEALRQQADDRAEKLKAELERKRKDLFDKDKNVDGQSKEKYNRPNSAKSNSRPSSAMKPVTPVPVTGVLKAIGVDPPPAEPAKPPPVPMTGALRAIGVESPSEPVREKSEIQSQKEEILKKLNDKHRGKWGPPGDIAVEENEESISARPKWGGGSAGDRLKDLSLEETASQMEVTCARDQVVKFGDQEDKARKHWGKPGDTVLGILKEAPICSDTVTISSEKSTASDGVKSPPVTLPKAIPGVGATIVISRKEPSGGTITIENSEAGSQESGDSKPLVEVKSQGKGELFEKVDKLCNEVTEKDTKKEDVMYIEAADVNSSDDVEKCSSGVLLGITTGNFDIGDAEMIRTCSVPNLSEIGKSEVEGNISELARITRSHSLDLSIIKEETSIIEADISLDEKSETDKNRDDKSNIVQKQSEDDTTAKSASCDSANDKDSADDENEDDEDEEELMSVRETMQSLLLQESDDDARKSVSFRLSSGTEKSETDEEKSPERQLSGTVKREKPDKYENEEGDVIKEGSDSGGNSSEDADDEESASGSHPSSRNVSHTDCSEGDFPDVSLGEFLESDDDDDCCTEFGDAEEDDDELFGRLEETRAFLEKELGDKKFSEVYRAIQALQEDEDENVEVGAKIAIDLLGKTKEHLYVKIFHLVMADSAFTEDSSNSQ